MFERYTEEARRVLFFARFEVTERGGRSIQPEHLMLGLLREGGQIDSILRSRGISPDDLRTACGQTLETAEKVSKSLEIPFSQEAKRVLQFAAEEADGLGHGEIGAGHLLLGLLREEKGDHARPLSHRGLQLKLARLDVGQLRSQPAAAADSCGQSWRAAHERLERIELLLGRLTQAAGDRPETLELAAVLFGELEALRKLYGQDPSA
jgi:ATP-dependent Clp protease ATP-binding subunit ClpC